MISRKYFSIVASQIGNKKTKADKINPVNRGAPVNFLVKVFSRHTDRLCRKCGDIF